MARRTKSSRISWPVRRHLFWLWSDRRQRRRSSVSFEPETDTLLAAMSSPPNDARQSLINDTILRLKEDGIWSRLDTLWVMAAHDEQAARLNWIAPGTFTLTAANSPAFTADGGFAGDGISKHLTGPLWSALTKFTLNDAHVSTWIGGGTNAAVTTKASIASTGGSATTLIVPRSATDTLIMGLNGGSASFQSGRSAVIGDFAISRTASNAVQGYVNGTQVSALTTASTSVNAATISLMRSVTNYSDFLLRVTDIGASLTSQQETDRHTIMGDYLTALGANP
jgi:hypothetical protein